MMIMMNWIIGELWIDFRIHPLVSSLFLYPHGLFSNILDWIHYILYKYLPAELLLSLLAVGCGYLNSKSLPRSLHTTVCTYTYSRSWRADLQKGSMCRLPNIVERQMLQEGVPNKYIHTHQITGPWNNLQHCHLLTLKINEKLPTGLIDKSIDKRWTSVHINVPKFITFGNRCKE